jgi:hypothetical protein
VTSVAGLLAWFRPVERQALRYESVSQAALCVVGLLAAGITGVALAQGFGRLPIALLAGALRGTQFGGPARPPGRLHLDATASRVVSSQSSGT